MRLVPLLVNGALLIGAAIPFALSNSMSQSVPNRSPLPRARILPGETRLQLEWEGRTYTINVRDLNVQVLDAMDCDRAVVVDRQILGGQRFFPNALRVNRQTGDVAVGVLLQECLETQTSAVFVIDLQPGTYRSYLVQIPGDDPIKDDFSTYPLDTIAAVGYLGGDLIIKTGDASGSEALLVFTSATTPAGQYAGCVLTRRGEGDRLCPPAQ
jgi:hypothetical protein